jgi:ABC-type phosphate transport system auxiliary subunit
MRNELNNVTSKLFKTDLAQHKVELESVNVGNYTSKANQLQKDFDNEYKKQILAVQDTVVKYNNMIGDLANNFDKEIELYKSKVKDLGIDYNSVPLAKVADAARKSIMNKPTYFKSIMDKLKSL